MTPEVRIAVIVGAMIGVIVEVWQRLRTPKPIPLDRIGRFTKRLRDEQTRQEKTR